MSVNHIVSILLEKCFFFYILHYENTQPPATPHQLTVGGVTDLLQGHELMRKQF